MYNFLRWNLKLVLSAPQESFATLANQYFADTRLMLDFCISRWKRGYKPNINQFLLFADYYSQGKDSVAFYKIDQQANISKKIARLRRNKNGHITKISFEGKYYEFDVDAEGYVTEVK